MTSVALPAAQPPGWWRVGIALACGWVLSAACLFSLALAGWGAGVYVPASPVPLLDHGWWAAAADLAVVVLAVLLTGVVVAGTLRRMTGAPVSEPALAVILLLTGLVPSLPLGVPAAGVVLGLLVAVLAGRRWALRAERRIPRRPLAAALAACVLVAASWGALHPLAADGGSVGEAPRGGAVLFPLENVSRFGVTVVGFDAGPVPTAPVEPIGRLEPREHRLVTLRLAPGACVRALPHATVRYRLLGVTLKAPLHVEFPGAPAC